MNTRTTGRGFQRKLMGTKARAIRSFGLAIAAIFGFFVLMGALMPPHDLSGWPIPLVGLGIAGFGHMLCGRDPNNDD